MSADLEIRPWWTFRLPEAVIHVPASSEDDARALMSSFFCRERQAWAAFAPLVSTRVTSRREIARSATGREP